MFPCRRLPSPVHERKSPLCYRCLVIPDPETPLAAKAKRRGRDSKIWTSTYDDSSNQCANHILGPTVDHSIRSACLASLSFFSPHLKSYFSASGQAIVSVSSLLSPPVLYVPSFLSHRRIQHHPLLAVFIEIRRLTLARFRWVTEQNPEKSPSQKAVCTTQGSNPSPK